MEFEQEEQLAAFCVDNLFWQKQEQHIENGEDCHLVWSIIRVGGEIINPEPEQPPELILVPHWMPKHLFSFSC